MNAEKVLQLREVRFRWPGQPEDCLRIPHLQLAAGERLMISGDSGCGKSTLLSLAAGVLLAQTGQIELMGQDWSHLSASRREQRRADHVGYLFQQFNLLPYLSPIDNVLLPCRLSALRAKRCQGRALEKGQRLLEALGIGSQVWHRPSGGLSVGQQQRVAAARALIGQPELLIADEPTSALDERRRDEFMQLLLEQCEQSGSALLFVSHDRRLGEYFEQVFDLPSNPEQHS